MFRVIFFGTSDFAIPSLNALLNDARFDVLGVVTQPDKPTGRHAVLTAPPIKQFFLRHLDSSSSVIARNEANSPLLLQPEKLSDEDFQSWINEVGPTCDAFVVVAYGKIISQSLIDLPRKGIVNVHGSLLPRWRGAAPIQAAIAAGDTQTGVTVMLIDAKLDHGPILGIAEESIFDTDIGQTLHDRLAERGGDILPDILSDYLEDRIQPREQDHDLATHCRTLSRDDGKLDFTKTSLELERQIRAYTPWPGNWMMYEGKRLKIHQAKLGPETTQEPGTIFLQDQRAYLACAKGTSLELIQIQKEGKTVQTATILF